MQKKSEIWTQRYKFIFKFFKKNPKQPTKSKMADEIYNGRQEVKMADM